MAVFFPFRDQGNRSDQVIFFKVTLGGKAGPQALVCLAWTEVHVVKPLRFIFSSLGNCSPFF